MNKYLSLIILFYSLLSYAEQEFAIHPDSLTYIKKTINKNSRTLSQNEINIVLKKYSEVVNAQQAQAILVNNQVQFVFKEMTDNKKLIITGNQALTNADILSILEVENDSNITLEKITNSLPKLKTRYESVGIKNVEVHLQEFLDDKIQTFSLEINEGKSAQIEDIIVLSQDTFLNKSLQHSLAEFKFKKIDKTILRSIEEKTVRLLISDRLLEAKIAKITPIYNQDRSSAKITIALETTFSYEFVFDGNEYFSDGNIISHFDLEKNYLNYIKNANLLIKDIEQLYKDNGFANANVSTKTFAYEKLRKNVIFFKIIEGPQLRIKDFNVVGKITRSPAFYENLLKTYLDELGNVNIFIKHKMDTAISKLAIHLKDEGYLKAEANVLEYKINLDSTVSISIQINENMLTQIRDIQFTGLKNFTSNHLHDVIELKPNSTLSLIKVYDSYAKLKNFYQKNGYLEFRVLTPPENLVRYVDNYAFADLRFEIEEGPQIIIKNIEVRGNSFTKDKVVLREIDLEPGMILTSDLINDSIVFLERTQLFSRAQIQTSDVNTNIKERTIYIDVQEKNPGLFSTGIGLSNDRGITLRGNAGLNYQNLAGTGRGVSSRGEVRYSLDPDVQYPENRIALGYYEPFLYFNRLRARISLVREQQIIDTDEGSDDVTVQSNRELNFFLEKQVNRRLKLIWNTLSLSSINTFNKNPGGNTTDVQIATIGPSVEWDRRNDTFAPSEGTFSTSQIEYSHPSFGSTSNETNHIEFVRATLGHTIYTPMSLNKRWVFVNDFRWGFVDNLSDKSQSGVPFNKLFYLGGRSTLRGFDLRRNERVPSLLEICAKTGISCDSIDDFKLQTSSTFYLAKTELRFPIKNELGGTIFYDGGAVFIKGIDIKDHYRDTAGLGLRYLTPIGALSAELGFKLDRKTNTPDLYLEERAYTFHISIGSY